MSISANTMVNTITKALDKQDEFNEKKYAKLTDISTVYKPQGSVNSPKDLPLTGNKAGFVYNILTTYATAVDMHGVHIKAGDNVVYVDDGEGNSGFDVLGGTTDLSNYYTKAQVDTQIGNTDEAISDYGRMYHRFESCIDESGNVNAQRLAQFLNGDGYDDMPRLIREINAEIGKINSQLQ